MDKLIIPKECVLQGEIRAAINQGDITIENGWVPGALKSNEGSIRLTTDEAEAACETISAQNGIVEIQAQEFKCRRILAQAAQLNAAHFRASEILDCRDSIILSASSANIEECRADKIELKVDQLNIKKIYAGEELIIDSKNAEFEEIVAKRIVLHGAVKCRRMVAEETVIVDSGKVVIKVLECQSFHAAPEVGGIVVLATCEEVRAEGVRGFLQPDELDMLADGATTADLTRLLAGPRTTDAPTPSPEETSAVSFQPPADDGAEEIENAAAQPPNTEETPPSQEEGSPVPENFEAETIVADSEPAPPIELHSPGSEYPTIPEVDAFEAPEPSSSDEGEAEELEKEEEALPDQRGNEAAFSENRDEEAEPEPPASTDLDSDEDGDGSRDIGQFMKDHMDESFASEDGGEEMNDDIEPESAREFASPPQPEEPLEKDIPIFSVAESMEDPEVMLEELTEDELAGPLEDTDLQEYGLESEMSPQFDDDLEDSLAEVADSDDSLPEIQGLEGPDEIEISTEAFSDDEVLERVDAYDILDDIPRVEEEPESIEELEILDEASLESVEIGSEEESPEDALVRDLIQILNQVRAYFHEGEDPKFVSQIHRYLEDRRFDLFMKTRNKEAVLAKFDKFDHGEISALARSFFNKLEAYMEQSIDH